MFQSARVVLIILITALDHLLHEMVLSFNTTRDFIRYRVKWILRDKLRVIWRGRRN